MTPLSTWRNGAAVPRSSRAPMVAGAATLLLLAGCGGGAAAPANSRSVACGPLGAQPTQTCSVEVTDRKGDLTLILRRPEGGFHRLSWPKGDVLSAADGAEKLVTAPLPGGGVEARIGGWAYRIEKKGGGLP